MAVILAADIGGTNCRLGLFRLLKNKLVMENAAWVETGGIADAEMLLHAFERELNCNPAKAEVLAVAIAGPVEDFSRGSLTNGALVLDFSTLNENGRKFYLLNDFTGQAYAVLSPEGESARLISGPNVQGVQKVRAVIGAGTGLGQAILVPLDGDKKTKTTHWLTLASENGHSAFPFANGAENDFHTFLRLKFKIPFATGENTVAGKGLAALHEFLTGEKLTPAQVGAQALSHETRTLEWYARFYARVCRNWILSTMCEGGLWIAGGIAVQNPLVITCGHFRDELYNAPYGSPQWSDFLNSVPIYLMEDTNSGLWGSARFGQQIVEDRMANEDYAKDVNKIEGEPEK